MKEGVSLTFYQELQLNQALSKQVIRNSATVRERLYHLAVYLLKIALTMAFCFGFVAAYSILFGNDNSIVGVVVLLCVLVFRQADLGVGRRESSVLFVLFFALMAVGPHAANLAGAVGGLFVNLLCLTVIMVLGCHDPRMSNHSTLVLSYLLLYGYDVSGASLRLRVLALAVGCVLTILVFCRTHKGRAFQKHWKGILADFHIASPTSRWQISLVLCVSLVLCISELCHMPRAMWAGIAAMSATTPQIGHMKHRLLWRIVGNVGGGLCFLLLYHLLPASVYAYIGILGGIGVGLSATYGWQAVFNTFGALAVATEAFGLTESIHLRVLQNVYGVLFAYLFCFLLNWLAGKFLPAQDPEPAKSR